MNCLVFHTSGGISSSPAAFLFLILLRTESSSSLVKGPSLMSNCLLIILVIGSSVIFGGFPSRFLKCCSHSFTLSCWLATFNFALAVLFLLLTSFIVCHCSTYCVNILFQYIGHHHHHVVPLARISLTLSRHFSLSFITSGRSSGLHRVSSHSCQMYVLAGRPAFAQSYVGVHRSTSLMSSSLLLQQCPACLVRLTWIVFRDGRQVAV